MPREYTSSLNDIRTSIVIMQQRIICETIRLIWDREFMIDNFIIIKYMERYGTWLEVTQNL